MSTVFIPAKKATRTRLSGFGGVSSQSIFMATNTPKPIPRGMGAADAASLVAGAIRRPLSGLGATRMLSTKSLQTQFTPVSTSSDGGSTTAWVIGGVLVIAAVGGLVYLSTRKR